MEQLLLVNPRKRRRARRKRKTTRKRRRNPRRSYVTGSAVKTNPRRRRRRSVKRRRKSYRRNPRRLTVQNVFRDTVMPSISAAGGGIALDVLWGMLPIPDALRTGPVRYLAKGAGAIGMGMVAGMFFPAATAKNFTSGAMTIVLYGALKEMLAVWAPNLALSSYDIDASMGYPSAALDVGSEADLSAYFPPSGMGAYLDEGALSHYDYESMD